MYESRTQQRTLADRNVLSVSRGKSWSTLCMHFATAAAQASAKAAELCESVNLAAVPGAGQTKDLMEEFVPIIARLQLAEVMLCESMDHQIQRFSHDDIYEIIKQAKKDISKQIYLEHNRK